MGFAPERLGIIVVYNNRLIRLENERKEIYKEIVELKKKEAELLVQFSWKSSQIEMIKVIDEFREDYGEKLKGYKREEKDFGCVDSNYKNKENNGEREVKQFVVKRDENDNIIGVEPKVDLIKVNEKITKTLILPNRFYEDFLKQYNNSIRFLKSLTLKEDIWQILNTKSFNEWEESLKVNMEIYLQDSESTAQYYGLEITYNDEIYCLASIGKGLILDEGEIITKAIDKFFEIDLDAALSGKQYKLNKPAVFRRNSYGFLELVEKGDLVFN